MDSLSTRPVGPLEKLPAEGAQEIHESSLRILGDVGIQVSHDEALELLDEHGCDVDRETELVYFPESLVMDCIEAAPSSFTLHARNSDRSVTVGDGGHVTSPCGGAPNVLTYEDGRRPSRLADYEDFVKLTQLKDEMTTTGYLHCEPNDVDQEVKHYELLRRSIEYSDKPLKGECWGADRARASVEMAGIANDDPDLSKPYVFATANSVSPRVWDTKMVGGLVEYAKEGQSLLLSPAVMASASGPATLAGTLALGNAEILAGNVIAQLVNEGTPVVYGFPTSNIDVRYGSFAIGSPEGALCVAFAGQMGNFYDVPTRAGGSLTDAKTPDMQAGAESMLQLVVALLSDVDLVHHAAGMLDSYSTSSPEKFLLDCESIRYVERFQDGYDVTEETLAEGLIADVEPGGHFLNKRHTLSHSKTNAVFSDLFFRDSYDNWEDQGSTDAFERAHERKLALLDDYEPPPLADDIRHDLESYVERNVDETLSTTSG
jgi:trimethylamine--corrinoid protein Co-methyltransferase